jgi:2-amino-4-hydroxy-6-hydroxymethyldihydropteridine diphosphokinase
LAHTYLIALGSNMRVPGIGGPRRVLAAACAAMAHSGLLVRAAAPVIASAPVGPSLRRYANGAALIETALAPEDLLDVLQQIERDFGRRRAQRRGARWRARALDCDIVLWSAGTWHSPRLTIPHPLFRSRDFVLTPAARIARWWRDPADGLTLAQLSSRLAKRQRKGRPTAFRSGARFSF